jgi:capsule polysaccharide export protein KpsE/RkpR
MDRSAGHEKAAQVMPNESRLISTLHILWEQRGQLLKWAAMGFVISLILAFVIPVRYTSSVEIMPPDPALQNAGLMAAMTGVSAPAVSAGIAGNLLSGRTSGGTFLGILQSRTVQDDLINRFDLRKVYRTRTYQEARKELNARTYASEDRKSGIITISVSDNDKYRARDLASAYIEELNKLVVLMDTSAAHRERIFLEERLKSVKDNLDAASLQLSQFSSRNVTMDVRDQGKSMLDATARLQGELIAAQSNLEGLKANYTDDNPRVREARARIQVLQSDLAKMGGTNAQDGMGLSSDEIYPSLRQLPLLGNTYLDLYRRTQILETVYEILSKEYELARIEEAKETPTVKLLDAPDLPEKKSFPPRMLIVSMGIFFAVIIACVVVLMHEWWLDSNADDAKKRLLLDILASSDKSKSWRERLGLARKQHHVIAGG